MTVQTIAMLAGALMMALAGGAIFVVAACSGHFDAIEEPKYRMLRDAEDEEENTNVDHGTQP